ncbi:MAG: hypothetical protein KC996_10100 [Phycisphaerales bacterium]|nr:hypothetical protein [Phycisphaerales bacterium]
MPNQPHASSTPSTREPSVLLSDLTGDLLWPKLLRAPAMALSPSRLMIGTVAAFVLTVLSWVPSLWLEHPPRVLPGSERAAALNPLDAFDRFLGVLVNAHAAVVTHPWTSLIVGIPMLIALSLFGCVIARSAAVEFSQGRLNDPSSTSAFVLRRASHLLTATLGPLVFAALLLGLIALGGFLISAPIVNIVGAILYALGLVLGVIVTLVLALHLLALPLIAPAVACEGADGFDAVQRSYAYIVGRPLRMFVFAAILFSLGSLSFALCQMLLSGSIGLTDWTMQLLANDAGARVLSGNGELGATQPIAHNIIEFWRALFQLVFAGYVISYFYTASTMLYLVIRRVCDGQEISELWYDDR